MELGLGVDIATANEIVTELFGPTDLDERLTSSSLSQLAISSNDLLESVNATSTNNNTATTATHAQNTQKESASSDETIVIIDEKSKFYRYCRSRDQLFFKLINFLTKIDASLACIDLTDLDDQQATRDNDDIIVEKHIESRHRMLHKQSAIRRVSRTLLDDVRTENGSAIPNRATTSSTLVDFRPDSLDSLLYRSRRRKRGNYQISDSHDATIILDDDLYA